jgi:1-aminocyclopropane-1-carboxylate synthase
MYIQSNREKLQLCYASLEEALGAVNVKLTPWQGTLMAWADFRVHLRSQTWDAEYNLWRELFARSRILLTTGKSCHSSVPGFFRVCFAWPAVSEEDPTVAMRELKLRLVSHFGQVGPQ